MKLRGARFNLQNDPLHDPQEVEDGHDAAEEDDDGQSLRKESKPLTSARRQRSSVLSDKSSAYLKSKDVFDQVPEHERRALFGVVQEHLSATHKEENCIISGDACRAQGHVQHTHTAVSSVLIYKLRRAALTRQQAELQIRSDSRATIRVHML